MAQMINGKNYEQGTPEWQRAMEEDRVRQAGIGGTAQGTAEGNAAKASGGPKGSAAIDTLTAMGLNIKDFMGGGSEFSASGGGGTGNGPTVGGLTAAAGPMAQIAPIDTSAAESASFARAKDQVGQETSGALTGLRAALGGRGLLGSGAESRGTTAAITKGQQQLGETSRDQAMTRADLAQKNAETNLGAAVTQRGQNISAAEAQNQNIIAQNNLELQRAQFNLQARQQSLAGLMAALSLAKGSY